MTGFLLLAFIFLIAGVIAVAIASRLGLGSVLGYLIAGIAIKPGFSVAARGCSLDPAFRRVWRGDDVISGRA